MHARHLLLLSLPWLLQGCGDSTASNLTAGGPAFNSPTGGGSTTTTPPLEQAVAVLQNVSIQVRMTFVEPEEATNFSVQVFDANTNQLLAGPLAFQRGVGQPIPDQLFSGLTGNFFRVVVQAEDSTGKPAGTLETILAATSQQLQALFSQLPILPPTRETGRISASAFEPGLAGDSNEPAISRDGRFVAFSSRNPGLLTSVRSLNPTRAIYLRDRKSNTTELISSSLNLRRTGSGTQFGDGSVRSISATDGSSNTILTGETQGATEARDPDLSADGRFVAYEQDNSGSQIRLKDRQAPLPFAGQPNLSDIVVTPAPVTAGVSRFTVSQGSDPSLSGDGAMLAYTGVISERPNQIILYNRASQSSRILSKTASGLLADGECAHPTFSPDGKLVFFSTVATNLAGQGGLMVFDVNSETLTRLAQPSAFACSVSDTGRFVVANIDSRLRLLDRQNNTDVEIPIPGALAAVRAPSISGDGRFVTFYSARTDLVGNDANAQMDVFAMDLQTLQLSRINLAGDGVAVQGGVDQVLSEGPVISKDGSRIAYASPDDMLVPRDLNASMDVFSSSNPTGGKLYVIGSNGRILRFDNIARANGNLTPAATLTNPLLTGATRYELYLDTLNDRLYVAVGPTNGRLLYIDNVSTKDGDVTATKFRGIGSNTAPGLFVDVERNLLYKGNQVFPSATALTDPVRTLTDTPTQILVDTRFQQLIFGNVGALRFYPAGTVANNTALRTVLTDRGNCRGLQFDPSPLGSTFSNNSNFSLISEGAVLGTNPLSGFNSLAVLDPSGLLLKLIRGNQTLLGLNNSPTSAPGPHIIDVTTGHTYCTSGLENRILVFHKPTQDSGDKAPDRILNLTVLPKAMAIDRTR